MTPPSPAHPIVTTTARQRLLVTAACRRRRGRHRLIVAVTALTLVVALAGCSRPATPNGSGTPGTTVVGLTYIPNIQFAPFYIADSNHFDTSDVAVKLRHHGASEGLFTALTTGEEQFVVAGGDEILQARTQGIDVEAVASYYGQYPARIIVPTGSPITSVADLKGHTIGLPGKYGENWFALLIALQDAGLSQSDVTIDEIGYTQQAALSTGKVDAVIGFANSDVITFQQSGFPVAVIDPHLNLVSICLATTTAYAQTNPQIVADVVAGMKHGMQTALDDPAAALSVSANYIPGFTGETLATAQQVLPATTALFTNSAGQLSPPFDPAQWSGMAQSMASVGLIPPGTDATAAYTNAFNG